MAYVGLRKMIVAKLNEDGTYGEPFKLGKAIGVNITPSYAEGSLHADDEQAEYDKEFSYADVTLNTSTLPIVAHETMFGHKTEGEKSVVFNKEDQANYVGAAWISVEKVNNIKRFIANFLTKVKFSEPSEEYTTKGESIEYKTPSVSGRAIADGKGSWKAVEICETEEAALAWIYGKFGAELPIEENVNEPETQSTDSTQEE